MTTISDKCSVCGSTRDDARHDPYGQYFAHTYVASGDEGKVSRVEITDAPKATTPDEWTGEMSFTITDASRLTASKLIRSAPLSAREQGRVRIMYVAPELVLDLFKTTQAIPDFVTFPLSLDAPPDMKYEAVQFDFDRQAFAFLVSSMTFDVVPCGIVAPAIVLRFETARLRRVRDYVLPI